MWAFSLIQSPLKLYVLWFLRLDSFFARCWISAWRGASFMQISKLETIIFFWNFKRGLSTLWGRNTLQGPIQFSSFQRVAALPAVYSYWNVVRRPSIDIPRSHPYQRKRTVARHLFGHGKRFSDGILHHELFQCREVKSAQHSAFIAFICVCFGNKAESDQQSAIFDSPWSSARFCCEYGSQRHVDIEKITQNHV
jgi:hypothetical protein